MNFAPFVDMTLLNSIVAKSWSSYFAGVVDAIPSHCGSSSMFFRFLGADGAYESSVCDIFHSYFRDIILVDKFDGVSALDAATGSISQFSKLVGG